MLHGIINGMAENKGDVMLLPRIYKVLLLAQWPVASCIE